ncbi:hypothetical protein K7432_017659 [Basidiobolus ranarum]|uniref:WW domain-containing protein n=1 Tax=Basidiobolus ranarum TaxID=34480 RepID=A0ABR2WD32_9FUNG
MDNRPLPPGWISQTDPQSNRTYYVNTNTGQSSWEDPRIEYYGAQGNGQQHNSYNSPMPSAFPDYNSYPGNDSHNVNKTSGQAPLGFAMPSGPDSSCDNKPMGMPGSNDSYSSGMPSAGGQSFGMPGSTVEPHYNGAMSSGFPTPTEYPAVNQGNSYRPGVMYNENTKSEYGGTSSTYTSGGESNQPSNYDKNYNGNTPQTPGSVDPATGDQERFLGINKPTVMGAVVGGIAGKLASSKLPSGSSHSQPQQSYYGGQPQQGQYYGGQPPQGQYYGAPPPQGQYYGAPPVQQPPKESGLGSVGSMIAGGIGGMAIGMVANKLMNGKHHGKH